MSTIVLKNSSVVDKVPVPNDLVPGELAVNTADGKIYMEITGGTVIDIVAHTAVTDAYQETYKIAGTNKILTTINAVRDSVIYDTSLDSDGGEWRFKEKSWSNEPVPAGKYLGEVASESAARALGGETSDWYQLTTAHNFSA